MKLQSRSRDEPEINVISLVDVLLVLVLFFMVSTSFLRETEITLKLPEADAQSSAAAVDDALEIMITRTGSYLVNGRELVNSERRTLRAAIERLVGERRDQPVYIRADAAATHQAVVTAMDVAGQLGFTHLNIAAVTPPEAQSQ
jgi:biopolymer transport protein ExbD